MILCFSGLGNTRYVAGMLADITGDKIFEFSAHDLRHPQKIKLTTELLGERIIWAFPTYGWLVPPVIENVIKYIPEDLQSFPHYMIATCGDDMGILDRHWENLILGRGWVARGAYAVKMPNTYVFLPGFDVDKPDIVEAKLNAVPAKVKEIAEAIYSGNRKLLIPGSFPKIKSDVLGPVFRKLYMSPKPFHATSACVGCGTCAVSCPMKNIIMLEGRPQWSVNCAFCLRCYHVCPHHAVAYGKQTSGKGRYTQMLKYVTKDR